MWHDNLTADVDDSEMNANRLEDTHSMAMKKQEGFDEMHQNIWHWDQQPWLEYFHSLHFRIRFEKPMEMEGQEDWETLGGSNLRSGARHFLGNIRLNIPN